MALQTSAFIDGFNLYHAIVDTEKHYLKWVDLFKLCGIFARPPKYDLTDAYFFSAFATWLPAPYSRHREYVKALEATGTTTVMGNFKRKDRYCKQCKKFSTGHEEKETDVNLALYLLQGAYENLYDVALVVSNDSDLVPAIKMVKTTFPEKEIKLLAPVGKYNSGNLVQAVGGQKFCRRLKEVHLEQSLLPREVRDKGTIVAVRPTRYAPP